MILSRNSKKDVREIHFSDFMAAEARAPAGAEDRGYSRAHAFPFWERTHGNPRAARYVDALIRRVPEGKLVTVFRLREELARRSGVDIACSVCTGIFLRIAAEAAEEERRAGKKVVTPYWRVRSSDGRLQPRFPGGPGAQRRMLSGEGHKAQRSAGKKPPQVANFEASLVRF